MADILGTLAEIVTDEHVLIGDAIGDDYTHDEALTAEPVSPVAVVRPGSTAEVAAILRAADEHNVPVTARGSGTGLSGAAIPRPDGILVSFERMDRILEIDAVNHVAVVQPGVTLDRLDPALAEHGLVYPVYPGEYSATIGGNIATNAGGMRAVKYGVTRDQVLGLEAVLAGGKVIRTGGKFTKSTTGYDLTQLIIGSEGTLALVTEAILRLCPRQTHQATVLAPFRTLDAITRAVPEIVSGGVRPLLLEYIDMLTMAAMTHQQGMDLGIPDDVRDVAMAYLVVMLEDTDDRRLDEDIEAVADQLAHLDAVDVYVLPPHAAAQLIEARERAFWLAKNVNVDDIIDVVVPRAQIPEFMAEVTKLAQSSETLIAGCGHAGDGNVHLSVLQRDPERRYEVMRRLFETGIALGGTISAEHGLGTEKKRYYMELEDPTKIELMRGIKRAFDPNGILNPGTIFD